MKHAIDPKVDCVFKALLGGESNCALLINFLNAFLLSDLTQPISEVEILNPYLEQEFIGDKFSIVDVKARNRNGQLYQIEIQLLIKPWLRERIVYNWAKLLSQQLHKGDDYECIRLTYSIWLLGDDLLPDNTVVHRYKLRDENARPLSEHGGIWLLELNKFNPDIPIRADDERWLKFFREGEQLDDEQLPDWMQTNAMRQAMDTLRTFSEKEREYHLYLGRQEFLHSQRSEEMRAQRVAQSLLLEQALRKEAEQGREEERQGREEERRMREQADKEREEERRMREQAEQREAQLLSELARLRHSAKE